MTGDHAEYAQWAAAYTLGALDAEDRRTFETHLATCGICAAELAELAPLPGLIARTERGEIEHGPDPVRADAITAAAKRELSTMQRRSRRWQLTAAGLAAVAAVLVAVLILTPVDGESDARPAQVAAVASTTAASTEVAVSPRAWGTEITLDITGLPARDRYQLWAIDNSGAWTSAATWSPTPSGVVRLTGATSSPTAELERIVITSDQRNDLLVEATLEATRQAFVED